MSSHRESWRSSRIFWLNITDNPVNAILNANYLCILAWALLFGLAMRRTSKSIKFCTCIHIGCGINRREVDYRVCTIWNHGTCVHDSIGEWIVDIQGIWQIAACACGRHAYGCIDRRSAPCDYRLKEKLHIHLRGDASESQV